MNKFTVITTLVFSIALVKSTEFTHDHKRIGPIGPVNAEHSCLEKFKVRENSIIRTQDSRELGAKFINESDVGNREDCLNICCNTKFCNVVVFEENTPFSCSLFDCGEPEEFRCRFTTHSYYTSAMINRHQLDLGIWSSQRKQESELASLRSMSESPLLAQNDYTSTPISHTTTTSTTSTTTTTLPPPTPKATIATVRKCSRFQFECHSGECIAIYNACDGIPQCQDGSDEGSDLSCPQSSAYGASSIPPDGPRLGKQSWEQQNQQRNQYDGQVFNHRTNILDYNRFPNGGSADYTREENAGFPAHSKVPGYYDYGQKPSWPVMADRYNQGSPAEPRRDQPSMYRHDYSDYSYLHQPSEAKQQNLPIQSNPARMNKQQFMTRPNNRLWQAEQPQYVPFSGQNFLPLQKPLQGQLPPGNDHSPIYPKENLPQNIQKNVNLQTVYQNTPFKPVLQASAGDSSPLMKPTVSNTELTSSKLDAIVLTNTTNSSAKSKDSISTSSQKTLISSQEKNEVPSHLSVSRYEIDISELEDKNRESHAQASGAVLALSLGVCITALLVVLVGCRMKGGKRRMRRTRGGRSKLEHDADYLVNGMYL